MSWTSGYPAALAANVLWGLFPLYWRWLDGVPVLHVFAHRVLWAGCFLALAVHCTGGGRRLRDFARAGRREWLGAAAGALLIALNWGLYLWAVASEQVVAASMGYFLYPLVAAALGALLFGERPRAVQRAALLLAATGVGLQWLVLAQMPWLSLALALSFGGYGALRKTLCTDPLSGQLVEAGLLAGPALVLLASGPQWLAGAGALQDALLIGGGVVTAVPLLLFVAATRRLPLQTTGMLFYLTPVIQFLLGALLFAEPISALRWLSIGAIWAALALFAIDGLCAQRAGAREKAIV